MCDWICLYERIETCFVVCCCVLTCVDPVGFVFIGILCRAIVDKMCYFAVFGTKSVFETKVPATARSQFHNYITDLYKADGAKQKFEEAWKAYVPAQ